MARLFVAVDIPFAARGEATRVTEVLRERVVDARWVPPQNLHLTLLFLGRTSMVSAVGAAVREAAAEHGPLKLRLKGAGAFPSEQKARVVWVGLAGDTAALEAITDALWKHLAPMGFTPEERPFSPHLTIGRLRMPGPADLSAIKVKSVPIKVAAITLYESSHLGRGSAVYTPLVVAPLTGTAPRS